MTTIELAAPTESTSQERRSPFMAHAKKWGLAMLHFVTERYTIPTTEQPVGQLLVKSAAEVAPVDYAEIERAMTADGHGGEFLDRSVGFPD